MNKELQLDPMELFGEPLLRGLHFAGDFYVGGLAQIVLD